MLKARSAILVAAAALIPFGTLSAQAPAKRPLDHDVYAVWDTIGRPAISNDGAWALYSLIGYDRDGELRIRATSSSTEHSIPRATNAEFDAKSRRAIFIIKPATPDAGESERRKSAPDTLGILDLGTGTTTKIPHVRSFRLPQEPERDRASSTLAYLLDREASEGEGSGSTLVIHDLESGTEHRFHNVTSYAFTKDGKRLAYIANPEDEAEKGIFTVDPATGSATPVLTGPGRYRSLTWSEDGDQLAFLSALDEIYSLYTWRPGDHEAKEIATKGSNGIPEGWEVSEYGSLRFSPNGRRLFFGTAPSTQPAPADSAAAARVVVDIWHWRDPQLQPQQIVQLNRARRQNYLAVVDLRRNRIVQLADEEVPQVTLGARGDADIALGTSDLPYVVENHWERPGYSDDYLIDITNGRRELVRERARGRASLSPDARYVTWFDNDEGWIALDTRSKKTVVMSEGIPYPLENEDHDTPSRPSAYGSAGWVEGGSEFIIYDRYDIWALDPTGKRSPRNLTQGVGRRDGIRFRIVRFDRSQPTLDPKEPLLLSSFHLRTKDAGFHRTTLAGNAEPEELISMARAFSNPLKAADADVLLYTRSSFEEFPDLWVANTDFEGARKISNANPQQSEYLWGTAELVEWRSAEGTTLQGILYKPEDFDPTKKYPMVTYFYERMSDGLHTHYAPVPHRSRINFTFYTSRGYLVFVPDIVYREGYPGESAMHAVIPGILSLLERGYIDPDRLGVQGHSWGGYQISYMVTRTDIFKAAIAGAPVANMTSAYGGIRWQTGLSRQFQYERTQSRLGDNLWNAPIRYIENSPLFWLDRVETPLLIMHNDQDGHVPWYQGIELFMGLRRLEKPTWLINYNDEPHWPTTAANKIDWNIRMQQYFDHYLMDAPAPVWMIEGVPAVEKGRTLGRELVEPSISTDH